MIYLLSENAQETAHMLDDKALDSQIKAVAQTLCNAHYNALGYSPENADQGNKCCGDIPLNPRADDIEWDKFTLWASECRANYNWLVKMGLACCGEYRYRFSDGVTAYGNLELPHNNAKKHKLEKAICWARDNAPDLGGNYSLKPIECDGIVLGYRNESTPTPFPVCMPAQYIEYLSSTTREGQPKPVDIVQSYRNYYRAQIKKGSMRKVKCEFCLGTGWGGGTAKDGEWEKPCKNKCEHCYVSDPRVPAWTRRPIPEFLEDLLNAKA